MVGENRRGGVARVRPASATLVATAGPSASATARLRHEVGRLGFQRLYQSDLAGISVLSVCRGLTVWCVGDVFVWRVDGQGFVHHTADPVRAARAVLDSYRDTR